MARNIKIMKFGGTSMGSADSMRRVIDIVRRDARPARGGARPAAVVVSAMSGVTDELIRIATLASAKDASYKQRLQDLRQRHRKTVAALVGRRNRARDLAHVDTLFKYLESAMLGALLVQELSPAALDYIMSYGERLSAHILCDALNDRGVATEYLNARAVITTDENFGAAAVDFSATNRALRQYFTAHPRLQVVTGFIASTKNKKTTTLGRGGSDYTAAIVGAALGAKTIEIWTDVNGVMTADPRKVPGAYTIPRMSYEEAVDMSYFGAKVIHPPTMHPARLKGIPILIKNTFEPEASGTVISKKAAQGGIVKGITSIGDIVILQVQGSGMGASRDTLARLFGAFASARANVIMISQASSQNSISIAVSPKDAARAKEAIEEEFILERRARLMDDVILQRDLSILAVVGEGMRHHRGVAGRLFQTLARNGINIVAVAQGSSELNITVVIRKEGETKALNAVHSAFFTPERRVVNVFLVGTGLIGGTLLRQIREQKAPLEHDHGYTVRVVGVANAKKMYFNAEGVPASWERALSASRTPTDIERFVAEMKRMSLPETVFVDCTASEAVVARYAEILSAGISIVTPNKRANSGPFSYYQKLRAVAAKHGVKFLYETNVGAGLPVIGTLKDLLLSGDRIRKIEAVLSGTLSYIFDNFNGKKPFSEIVREARARGFAEPDPRDDLSGLDVARKILILARETGLPLELKDVKVETLLSRRCRDAKTVEAFFRELRKEDAGFEKKRKAAEARGKVLRYVATLAGKKASVSLMAVDKTHPFYALYGNDNVITLITDRYKSSPLIVQGPGAGAEVTAAGVFADILRTAHNSV